MHIANNPNTPKMVPLFSVPKQMGVPNVQLLLNTQQQCRDLLHNARVVCENRILDAKAQAQQILGGKSFCNITPHIKDSSFCHKGYSEYS